MREPKTEEIGEWRSVEPAEAAAWLTHLTVPWWIAGGWALDLFLGQRSRAHTDLDIGVLRRDIATALQALSRWELFEAKDGGLNHLPIGTLPRADVHSLWCRPEGTTPWALEIMLDESDEALWLFRREPTIRRPLSTLTRTSSSQIRYLAPEIQLLYKAKTVRPQDQADFERVVQELDALAVEWLRDSLARAYSGHPWINTLDGSKSMGA